MLQKGNCPTMQRPPKTRTLSGTRHRPKPSQLSAVKANNRALAAALDNSKKQCSKLKDDNLSLRQERQELLESIIRLRTQLQTQHVSTTSVQAAVDQLTEAQHSIAQAKVLLTKNLPNNIPASLSPIPVRDVTAGGVPCSGSVTAGGVTLQPHSGVHLLSPPAITSSPGEAEGQTSHSPTGSAARQVLLPNEQDGYRPLSNKYDDHLLLAKGKDQMSSLSIGSMGQESGPDMDSLEVSHDSNREGLPLDRKSQLVLDITAEEEEEEGVNSRSESEDVYSDTVLQRPKRKCAPLSASLIEPSLRDKLRRGDPFTTSFTTWSPCDKKDKSRSRKHYSTKRVALANITNKN